MAKVFDHLYPQLYRFDNVYTAWQKAAKGKRSCPAAASFEMHLTDELIRLQAELASETWQPGAYIYD